MLFWMVVILGYRRQRNFERVFFFLCLSLFLFYSGSLLAINAQIFYSEPGAALQKFAAGLVCFGLAFLPPLLFHVHVEFAEVRGIARAQRFRTIALILAYLPVIYFVAIQIPDVLRKPGFNFVNPGNSLGQPYLVWLLVLALLSAAWERIFAQGAALKPENRFHLLLAALLASAIVLIALVHFLPGLGAGQREALGTALALLPLPALSVLIYLVQRHNFLNIGKQKNLLYAVSTTFVALLYLALVRRVSESLAAIFPPEATAATLLFLLVIFIEPLQRALGQALRETAQKELDVAQRLGAEIRQEARNGNLSRLSAFIERRVVEQLGLRSARLELFALVRPAKERLPTASLAHEKRAAIPFDPRDFVIVQDNHVIGSLHAEPHGAAISGDTAAALEILCEQIPGAFDLCRLIEDKLRLERELAERERMAVLGQMAASISHNLKNPLGSIKTILQVQMESRELPESFRAETTMVLEEVNRLSSKLNQLLQFSRPAILGQSVESRCDARDILREVTEVLRAEADRRGVSLERPATAEPLHVAIAKEALNDIVTNLLVNALDAASPQGHIRASVSRSDGFCTLYVEDDGPGIPADLQEKILQPFFTTKSQGTGLGLAIVARRVTEAKGRLDCQSPAREGRGTRFCVRLPVL